MSDFNLRAHHAMCLYFFTGKGYNNEFVENMNHILESLSINPRITIINEGDEICNKCPNFIDEKCVEQEKVNKYDHKVLQYCLLKRGDSIYWKDFQDIIYKNIIAVHKREKICKDCEWNKICVKNNGICSF